MSKTCVILQPTFLPWVGWFDLADQADVTILLDDVQFSKQSWQQRNRIKSPNGLELLSVPVITAGRLGQRILDCDFANQFFVGKMLKTLQANYAKAPFFAGAIDELATIMTQSVATGRLVELNCALIHWMAAKLDVKVPMIRSSTLGVAGTRGEHVALICAAVDADSYLSPAGGEAYLNEDRGAFESRDVSVWLHVYDHPQYRQCFPPFIPYASALDLIFNVGPSAPAVMRSGRRPSRRLTEGPQTAFKDSQSEN